MAIGLSNWTLGSWRLTHAREYATMANYVAAALILAREQRHVLESDPTPEN